MTEFTDNETGSSRKERKGREGNPGSAANIELPNVEHWTSS